MYLLDTNILSDLMKKSPSDHLLEKMHSIPVGDQFTSSITLGELLYGALKKESKRLLDQVRTQVTEKLPILPFDSDAASRYAEIRVELERAGTPLNEPDLRIAGIALARNLTVVTDNVRHFVRIPGLAVENWLRPRM